MTCLSKFVGVVQAKKIQKKISVINQALALLYGDVHLKITTLNVSQAILKPE